MSIVAIDVIVFALTLNINISDAAVTTDPITLTLPDAIEINVSDAAVTTDPVAGEVSNVDTFDSAVTTDPVTISLPDAMEIDVSDLAITIDPFSGEHGNVDTFDLAVTTDQVTIGFAAYEINVNDQAVTTDPPAVENAQIDVSDNIVTTDPVTISLPNALEVSIVDQAVTTDQITVENSEISTSDNIVTVDPVTISLPDAIEINVNDQAVATDPPTVQPGGNIVVSDTSMTRDRPFFVEQFENPSGYDEDFTGWAGSWTETTSGGASVDTDYATSNLNNPIRWGVLCFKTTTVANHEQAKTANAPAADKNKMYFRFKFNVGSAVTDLEAESDGWNVPICTMLADGASDIHYILYLWNDGGTVKFQFEYHDDGSDITEFGATLPVDDTTYLIEIYYNSDANEYEWRVDNVNQGSGSIVALASQRLFQIGMNGFPAPPTTIYYDNVVVDTQDWLVDWMGPEVLITGPDISINVSDNAVTTDPPTLSVQSAGNLDINVSDNAVTTDPFSGEHGNVDTSDNAVTLDPITIELPDAMEVDVNSLGVTTDPITLTLPDALEIDINDQAVTADVVTGDGGEVDTFDDAVVSDTPTISLPDAMEINTSDSGVTTDTNDINVELEVNVSDQAVTIDPVTVSIEVIVSPQIDVSDNAVTTDSPTIDVELKVSTTESPSVTDVGSGEVANIDVSDNAVTADQVTVRPDFNIDVNDAGVTTDPVTITLPDSLEINVNSQAVATDFLITDSGGLVLIDVSDSVAVADVGIVGSLIEDVEIFRWTGTEWVKFNFI